MPANLEDAIPLGQTIGITVGNGWISLEEFSIMLQNLTHWTVQVEAEVADIQVGPDELSGPFRNVVRWAAESNGVEFSIDPRGKTVTFLGP